MSDLQFDREFWTKFLERLTPCHDPFYVALYQQANEAGNSLVYQALTRCYLYCIVIGSRSRVGVVVIRMTDSDIAIIDANTTRKNEGRKASLWRDFLGSGLA